VIDYLKPETPKLAEKIWALCQASYEFGSPWSVAQFASNLKLATSGYVAYQAESQIVGFVGFSKVLDEIEVDNLVVHPQFQGKRIAHQLLHFLEKKQLATGGKIFLEVRESNVSAKNLYKKCGFVEINRRKMYYKEPLEDGTVMMKEVETCQLEN
jgi:ribosomal-protein-alanine N-acetyltransferase